MPQPNKNCVVCKHFDVVTLDRFLLLPEGVRGKRGARSLGPRFGLDRRAIARHERQCLVGERREKAENDLVRMGASREL